MAKPIHEPPHGPLCDCGWGIPSAYVPNEWAPFENPTSVIECPVCGALYQIEPLDIALTELTCDGKCEPMCVWCHKQADIAAEHRE